MTDATSLLLRKSLDMFDEEDEVPELLDYCADIAIQMVDAYLEAEHFAIHVLTADQAHLANHFAQKDHKSYDRIEHTVSAHGVPILPDVLARFDCRTDAIHEGGDHHIIVGEVLHHEHAVGSPLLFYSGDYAAID